MKQFEPYRRVISFNAIGEEMPTVARGKDFSRRKLLALILAVSGLSTIRSGTQAADPADGSSGAVPSSSGDTFKPTRAKYEGLPHRQEWELFRQGNSPARDCPGSTAMLIEVAGTVFFLECQRIHP